LRVDRFYRHRHKFRKKKVGILRRISLRYFDLAYRAFENNEIEKSIKFYGDCVRIDSKNAQAFYNRALAFSAYGRGMQAMQDLNRAIFINPYYSDAYKNRGIILQCSGDLTSAMADFDKATSSNRSCVGAYYFRANLYYNQGDFERAFDDYSSAISNNISQPEYRKEYENKLCGKAFVYRGNIYKKRCEIAQALADYEESYVLNPNSADPLTAIGILYFELHDYKNSVEYTSKAIELEPNQAGLYLNRGHSYLLLGEYQKA
jgi:tetratricopeptide (TPR) repeat protein